MSKVRKSKYFPVKVRESYLTVLVDEDAIADVRNLPLTWSERDKLKISQGGRDLYPTLGSLPEQLYGSAYRMARHIADSNFDLRRSAYQVSKARRNRMRVK